MHRLLIIFFLSQILILSAFASSYGTKKTERELFRFIKDWGYLENYYPSLINGNLNSDSLFNEFAQRIIEDNKGYSRHSIIEYLIDKSAGHDPIFSWDSKHEGFKIIEKKGSYPTLVTDSTLKSRRVLYLDSTYQIVFKTYFDNNQFFPTPSQRILGLSKIWNNYKFYYPYQKNLRRNIGYIRILKKYISKIINCTKYEDYHLAIHELTSEYRDAHSQSNSFIIRNHFGTRVPPFRVRYINGEIIVTSYYSKLLFDKTGLIIGDNILEINNESKRQIFKRITPYISHSNSATLYRGLVCQSIKTTKDSIGLKVKRNGKYIILNLSTYYLQELLNLEYKENQLNGILELNDSTLFVACKTVDTTKLRKILTEDRDLKWFIFDLRSSTEWIKPVIKDFFFDSKIEFGSYFKPIIQRPGFFTNPQPISIGPGNPDLFIAEAHVIILVNEHTQSQDEFQAMFLQAIPNAVTIGSQTAGADGNVSFFKIPGNIEISMTGLGIQYPDGKKTQISGVKINHYISTDLRLIKKGIDQELEYALKLIAKKANNSFQSK